MNFFIVKIIVCVLLVVAWSYSSFQSSLDSNNEAVKISLKQLDPKEDVSKVRGELTVKHQQRNNFNLLGWIVVLSIVVATFYQEIINLLTTSPKRLFQLLLFLLTFSLTGCWRPFEPVKLETIRPNEEAFLIPYTENADKQTSTHTEDFLRQNLVFGQQVRITQQWHPLGFETFGANGEWKDAAVLIKVNKSPVTREWTADEKSGTSTRNEAVWVMTSDQVEFSTGWTCTARIASRDDAVKFLYNYPNGELEKVMDTEVRSQLASTFGLEVTDLPMTELRLSATPHIQKVVVEIKTFFAERGITITNLGITGGFVYKDPSIKETLVKVFNAEQQKAIASAGAIAQLETNKKTQYEADGKAKALRTEKETEADTIKLVADAKSYEIEKAKENFETYLSLKRLEVEKIRWEKWDGKFPTHMGAVDLTTFFSSKKE